MSDCRSAHYKNYQSIHPNGILSEVLKHKAHVLHPTYSTHAGQLNCVANQGLPECMSCLGYVHVLSSQLSCKSCYTGDVRHQPCRANDVKLWRLPRVCKVESVHEILVPICWRFLLVEQPSQSYCSTSAVRHLEVRIYSKWPVKPEAFCQKQ